MMGPMHGMAFGMILAILSALGIAYIVWILANKESKLTKLIGQIISIVIAILAILMVICAASHCGKMCNAKAGMTDGKGSCMMNGMQMDKGQMKEMIKAHEKITDKKPK